MGWLSDESGLQKCPANHVALTPLSHLRRAARVFPEREALIYATRRYTYQQYHERVSRLASGLSSLGVAPGDVVATILPNVPAQAEAHFGIPAAGAVINAINIRLDVDTVRYILEHGEAKVVLVDPLFLPVVEESIAGMDGPKPRIVEVADPDANHPASGAHLEYEALLETGDPDAGWIMPEDEWESLSLNYTSGTTGRPKGVVYHHRGAYLMTMGTVISWRMVLYPRFLAVVPMFHCNGWAHTWLMPVLGGTVICCRDVTARGIYDAIADEGVTHFGGAPIVLNMIVNAPQETRRAFSHTVEVLTAGAPPAQSTLLAIESMGFNVMQVYGLTETYGHICESLWNHDFDDHPEDEKAAIKARQGVGFPMMEEVTVMDETDHPVAKDGASLGEIVVRGNCVMKGYYKNPQATDRAFQGGYFHSEDIAFQHPDGMIQVTDRAKDIIISGGENISSVEIENVLMAHPAVSVCAVVAKPDEKWGEVPCAFVELKPGASASEQEIIAFIRQRLAGFKTPKRVVFEDLPKTSTGKIQKYELRKRTTNL